MTTQVQVTGGELPQEEIQAYIEHGKKSYPGREIPRMEIASVQRVDPRQMRWVVPLFGGYGFFGYYGYYFDLKTFEKVVVYASEWKNLVEIVDIYEQRYYVSCTQADELVALLQSE